MKRILLMSILIAFTAFLMQSCLTRAADDCSRTYVLDKANVLTNDAEIEKAARDFCKVSGVIMMVETVEKSDSIEQEAAKRFMENGLNKAGTPTLNTLIFYAKNTRLLLITHADKCSLDASDIDSARTALVEQTRKSGYNNGFLQGLKALVEKAAEKAKKNYCAASEGPQLEFGPDRNFLYGPKPGLGLDEGLNPYDDGIVTAYDGPLYCVLSNAGNLEEAQFTITNQVNFASGGAEKCKDGKCIKRVDLNPEEHRGTKFTCSVTIGDKKLSKDVIVANRVFVFAKVNQDEFGDAQKAFDFFIGLTGANKKSETSIKAIYLKDKIDYKYSGGELRLPDLTNLASNVKMTRYLHAGPNDKYIFICTDRDIDAKLETCAFTQFNFNSIAMRKETSSLCSISTHTLSHELGHSISSLCDEYEWEEWYKQNKELKNSPFGGCPNSYPVCCDIAIWQSSSCRTIEQGQNVQCAGMPYKDDRITPAPELGHNANYYSIMGLERRKGFVYPINIECLLKGIYNKQCVSGIGS